MTRYILRLAESLWQTTEEVSLALSRLYLGSDFPAAFKPRNQLMPIGKEEVTQIMLCSNNTLLPVMDGLANSWAFSYEGQATNIPHYSSISLPTPSTLHNFSLTMKLLRIIQWRNVCFPYGALQTSTVIEKYLMAHIHGRVGDGHACLLMSLWFQI